MANWLDSMMWSIAASGILVAIAAVRLRYNASSDTIEEENKSISMGIGVALAINGIYLFITGLAANVLTPYGAKYSILFGGAGALGGLVLLSIAFALIFKRGLQGPSYFALVTGIYLIVDAIAILQNQMTKSPTEAALLFMAPAAAMILSVPATHVKSKAARYVFAVFAFLFAIGWLYFAYTTTLGHLGSG